MAAYAVAGAAWSGSTITWSFALQTFTADQAFPFSGVIDAAWQSPIRQALAKWSEVSGLTFVQVADATDPAQAADIRIGWGTFGLASGKLGEAALTAENGALLPDVIVRLEDPNERALAPDSAAYTGTSTNLYALTLHEIGHALGLGHATDPLAVMYPTLWQGNGALNNTDLEGIRVLYPETAGRLFSIFNTATNILGYQAGTPYDGPVSHLLFQYIGSAKVDIIGGTPRDDFINAQGGDDAIDAGAGDDVLDGGTGSNFLVGGQGSDVFFLDGRSGHSTWSTIADWQAGEQLSLWGWRPGVSQAHWVDVGGLGSYSGATLHADLDGNGTIDASVTWAHITRAQLPAMIEADGLLWLR